MQKGLKVVLFAVQLLLFVHPATAAEKRAISLKHVGEDAVGNRFVYVLREEITKSSQYVIFSGDKLQLAANTNLIEVEVVSVDTDPDRQGLSSAISTLITVTVERPAEQRKTCGDEVDINLNHEVSLIGAAKADQAAKEFMAQIDKTMHAE